MGLQMFYEQKVKPQAYLFNQFLELCHNLYNLIIVTLSTYINLCQ